MDSTRLSLYAITEVSRKPKHALLTIDFKTYTFRAWFSLDQSSGVRDLLGGVVPLPYLWAGDRMEEWGS